MEEHEENGDDKHEENLRDNKAYYKKYYPSSSIEEVFQKYMGSIITYLRSIWKVL